MNSTRNVVKVISIRKGVAGWAATPLPKLGRNLLHSGNFSERIIGNLGNFSDFALLIRAKVLQSPKLLVLLQLWSGSTNA